LSKTTRKTSKPVRDEQKPIFHCGGESDFERIAEAEDKLLTKKPGVKILSTARRIPTG